MSYKFLENVATADTAFEAKAKTLEELFCEAGRALEDTQVNLSKVEIKKEKKITLEAKSKENLLFDFLGELVYLKDAEGLVFKDFNIKIQNQSGTWKLKGTLKGEKLDPEKHKLGIDVKAVTKHMFEVKKEKETYKAVVVLDV